MCCNEDNNITFNNSMTCTEEYGEADFHHAVFQIQFVLVSLSLMVVFKLSYYN